MKTDAFYPHRYSNNDQENLSMLINEWMSGGQEKIFFRKSTESTPFLLVHQSQQQKYLMDRYGNELCSLDATYRTSKYALYVFFVVVKTNIDYQVRFGVQKCDKYPLTHVANYSTRYLVLVHYRL